MEINKYKQTEIKTENESDRLLVEKVFSYKQEHVFRWWNELPENERNNLFNQLKDIDFTLLQHLIKRHIKGNEPAQPNKSTLKPPDIIPIPQNDSQRKYATESKEIGVKAIKSGKTAVITVAGGLGTRLGANRPKGTLPISPVTLKSIFQLHAEKILATMKRYDTIIPWYIMTSGNNDKMTREFFEENHFFGFSTDTVYFFTQDTLPVLDLHGKLLMDSKSTLVTSPNGHGGTFFALKEKGIVSNMNERGVRHIFYHQVDNVLINIADPVFLGYHIHKQAKMSPKVVMKTDPEEKVGIIGIRDGYLDTIEYSELSKAERHARNPDGNLRFGMGNPAIYLLDVDFVEKVTNGKFPLPYHKAVKKVACVDDNGKRVIPAENNAVKFEMFIFDALKHAQKSIIMEVAREEEFSPVKNVDGNDSPDTAIQHMTNRFGRWLSDAGINIPKDKNGNVRGKIEISPLYALDAEELKNKINQPECTLRDKENLFTGELYLQ